MNKPPCRTYTVHYVDGVPFYSFSKTTHRHK
jgi:hypothetical protein